MFSKVRALLRANDASSAHETEPNAGAHPEAHEPEADTACPAGPLLNLERCPVCGGSGSTRVSKYNRFILFDGVPDAAAPIYNYALCHDCGVVYAQRRPAGERYWWLLERFEETLGRAEVGVPRPGKFALSSSALSDDAREQLRRLIRNGVFVSGTSGLTRKDYLPSLMNDRLANSMHAEILGSLLPLRNPRVLEIRSRLASIGAILQRLYGATCAAMTIFENQRFLIEEVYGFPAACPIDFDSFAIPFEGQYGLIVSNHMLTHTVDPQAFLGTVRERLTPGGHVYIYNEPMEGEFLDRGKSMFNTLNPFHLQTFNERSAVRALEANGFHVIFCTVRDDLFLAIAQAADPAEAWTRMDDHERGRRRSAYRAANDTAILRVPEHLRAPFAKEWDEIANRAVAAGLARRTKDGLVKVNRVDADSRED